MSNLLRFRTKHERHNRDQLDLMAANDSGGWLAKLLGTIDDLEQMLAIRPDADNSTAKHALEDLHAELWCAVDNESRTDD